MDENMRTMDDAESREAAVDYNVAKGQSEKVVRTVAYNTSDINNNPDNDVYEGGGNAGNEVGGYDSYGTDNTPQSGSNNESSGITPPANEQGQDNCYPVDFHGQQGDSGEFYGDEAQNRGAYENDTFQKESPYTEFNFDNGEVKNENKKSSYAVKRIIAAVVIICLCGLTGFGGGALAVNIIGTGSTNALGGSHTIKIDSDVSSMDAASAIAEKVMPSVVGISTVSQVTTQTIFGLRQGTATGVGTGIIVSEDGYIITNSHVVNGGDSSSITVDLYDGTEYNGDVLWSDESVDLAIVKIDASGLTAAEMGDSDEVKIGDYAVAIGNPLGLNLERSVTQGIISGLDRSIVTSDETSSSQNEMEGLIQTDASINSGNSGGPLINSNGQVIGINTAKASSAEGLGFAIPINTAIPIIEELKETGTYEKSYIGISGMNLAAVIQQYQTDFKAEEGVYIQQIYTNSPAAEAGLQEGDIITALDGEDIKDMSSLQKKLVQYRPGDKITLTIERNKANQNVELTLASASEYNINSLQPSNSSDDSGVGNNGDNGDDGSGWYYINPNDLENGLGSIFGN